MIPQEQAALEKTLHFILTECDIKIDLALVIDNSGSIADKNVKNETNHTITDNYITLKVRLRTSVSSRSWRQPLMSETGWVSLGSQSHV